MKNTDTAAFKSYTSTQEDFRIKRHIGVDAQDFAHTVAVINAGVKIARGYRRCANAWTISKECSAIAGRQEQVSRYV